MVGKKLESFAPVTSSRGGQFWSPVILFYYFKSFNHDFFTLLGPALSPALLLISLSVIYFGICFF